MTTRGAADADSEVVALLFVEDEADVEAEAEAAVRARVLRRGGMLA